MRSSWSEQEILGILAGDPRQRRQFSADLVAKVHFSVAAELRRRPTADRSQMEDLVQSVLVYMVNDSWRVLRLWDPARGMSFWSFASLITRKRVARLLQPTRKPLSVSDFTGHDEPKSTEDDRSLELELDAALRLADVLRRVEHCKVNERDRRIAYRVLVEDGDRAQICAEEKISRANIDQIVKRCRDRLRHCMGVSPSQTSIAPSTATIGLEESHGTRSGR